MKNWLGPQSFTNNKKLMEGVKTWLNSSAADFFDTGIQKHIPRYEKCFSSGGDYVGKQQVRIKAFFYIIHFFPSLPVLLTAHRILLSEQTTYIKHFSLTLKTLRGIISINYYESPSHCWLKFFKFLLLNAEKKNKIQSVFFTQDYNFADKKKLQK
jgi:hypothetical protein